MDTLLDKYVTYLNKKTNKKPELLGIESSKDNMDMLYLIFYNDYPVSKVNTAFTFGLSFAGNDEWKERKPELSITLNTDNMEYFQSMGYLAEWQRGDHSFKTGSLFRFGKPIASDTFMDSFLVFDQVSEDLYHISEVDLDGLSLKINALYPLYNEEVPLIKKVGIKKFFGLNEFHPYDINRPDLSKLYEVRTENNVS